MLLPIRFGPSEDEDLLSYVLRLSAENGYSDPRWIIAKAELKSGFYSRPCDLSRLADLVGNLTSAQELENISNWPTTSAVGKLKFGKREISIHSLDITHPKICVPCLKEGRIIPRIWQLRAFLACPRHGCALTYACRHCQKPLSWFRPGLLKCVCGNNLSNEEPFAPLNIVGVARVLECIANGEQTIETTAPVNTLDAASRLVWFAGTHRTQSNQWRSAYIGNPGPAAARQVVGNGAAVLLDWSRGLQSWLESHRSPAQSALSSAFGPLLVRMRNAFDGREFEAVINEVRKILNAGPDSPLIKTWAFFYSPAVEQPSCISGAHAARVLRQSGRSVARAIADGRLIGESRVRGGRLAHVVNVDSVQRLADERKFSITSQEASELLGISRFQIERFRHAKLLDGKRHAHRFKREFRYRLADVEEFAKKLVARSKREDLSQRDLIRLCTIPQYRTIRLANLVCQILDRRVEVFVDTSACECAPIFKRIGVRRAAIFGRTIGGENELLSVKTAARRLHLSARMIPILVRAKCLATSHETGRKSNANRFLAKCSVTAKSVDEFRKKFVVANDLAKVHSVSTRTIANCACRAGIEPVVVSDSNRGISAVWHKAHFAAVDIRRMINRGQ